MNARLHRTWVLAMRLSVKHTGYEMTSSSEPTSVAEIWRSARAFRIDRENETDRQLCCFEEELERLMEQEYPDVELEDGSVVSWDEAVLDTKETLGQIKAAAKNIQKGLE